MNGWTEEANNTTMDEKQIETEREREKKRRDLTESGRNRGRVSILLNYCGSPYGVDSGRLPRVLSGGRTGQRTTIPNTQHKLSYTLTSAIWTNTRTHQQHQPASQPQQQLNDFDISYRISFLHNYTTYYNTYIYVYMVHLFLGAETMWRWFGAFYPQYDRMYNQHIHAHTKHTYTVKQFNQPPHLSAIDILYMKNFFSQMLYVLESRHYVIAFCQLPVHPCALRLYE